MADVDFHPAARREYQAAVEWYRGRSARAARRLVAEFERVLGLIAARPDRFGWYEEPFREAVLRRFPFSVVYRVEAGGNVLVFAVAHASREPGYWQGRA